jgi:hypothetical protein
MLGFGGFSLGVMNLDGSLVTGSEESLVSDDVCGERVLPFRQEGGVRLDYLKGWHL